jgi:hypothetical protein
VLTRRRCCCTAPEICSTFYCPACSEFLAITQGTVTDDNGTHALDSTGTTARISWTTPNGYNGINDTPTTITTQYYYTFVCQDVAGVHKVILAIHFWTIDVNGDGSVWLYDAPDVSGEEDGASSAVTPSGCDPLASSHTFVYNAALPPEPTATATVSIPKANAFTCSPCCIPSPPDTTSLTATFANPASGSVCTDSTASMAPIFLTPGNAAWAANFCSPPRPSPSPLRLIMYCDLGTMSMTVTNPGDVNPLTDSYSLVDCTFSGGVYHAHFHGSASLLNSFQDIYVDS